jgi:hypothetical protein
MKQQQTLMAKQAFDLAMLAQGLLKGADLTAFVERVLSDLIFFNTEIQRD